MPKKDKDHEPLSPFFNDDVIRKAIKGRVGKGRLPSLNPPGKFHRSRIYMGEVYSDQLGGSQPGAPPGPPLANLALWLQADQIVGLVDNDPVALWEDSSGNNNDYTQGTAANRPLYKVNIINGKPVVRFDATNDALIASAPIASGPPLCTFAVLAFNIASATKRALTGSGGPGGNWFLGTNSANVYRAFNGGDILGGAVAGGVFKIFSFLQLAGPVNTFFVNGVSQGSNALTHYPGTIVMGAAGDIATNPANGDIAEVLVYTANVSSLRTQIEAYLMAKYGI